MGSHVCPFTARLNGSDSVLEATNHNSKPATSGLKNYNTLGFRGLQCGFEIQTGVVHEYILD